jgi:hypothetical protein
MLVLVYQATQGLVTGEVLQYEQFWGGRWRSGRKKQTM